MLVGCDVRSLTIVLVLGNTVSHLNSHGLKCYVCWRNAICKFHLSENVSQITLLNIVLLFHLYEGSTVGFNFSWSVDII